MRYRKQPVYTYSRIHRYEPICGASNRNTHRDAHDQIRSTSKARRTSEHINTQTHSVVTDIEGKYTDIREIDYRQMQHKTRLLIGKVIWKSPDLSSERRERIKVQFIA